MFLLLRNACPRQHTCWPKRPNSVPPRRVCPCSGRPGSRGGTGRCWVPSPGTARSTCGCRTRRRPGGPRWRVLRLPRCDRESTPASGPRPATACCGHWGATPVNCPWCSRAWCGPATATAPHRSRSPEHPGPRCWPRFRPASPTIFRLQRCRRGAIGPFRSMTATGGRARSRSCVKPSWGSCRPIRRWNRGTS